MLAAWPSGNARRLIFKLNCDRSWITAVTLVPEVETWKSAASPATHFRRSFKVFITVCSLSENPHLIYVLAHVIQDKQNRTNLC